MLGIVSWNVGSQNLLLKVVKRYKLPVMRYHSIQIGGVWGKSTWFLYRTLKESSIHPHTAPTRGFKLMTHRLHPIHKGLLFGLYTTAFKFVSCPLFFFFNGWDSILKFWVFSLLAKSEEVNIMVKIRRLSRSSLLLPMGGYFPVSHSLYSSSLLLSSCKSNCCFTLLKIDIWYWYP